MQRTNMTMNDVLRKYKDKKFIVNTKKEKTEDNW